MDEHTTDTQDKDLEDKVVARIGRLENRMMAQLNNRDSRDEVRIVSVEIPFGDMVMLFFKAFPAYLFGDAYVDGVAWHDRRLTCRGRPWRTFVRPTPGATGEVPCLTPNPPKVWRYSSGMGDEGQGEAMVRARFRVNGAGVCLQPPRGDLATVWGRWARRDGGERTQRAGLADQGGASLQGSSVGRMAGQLQTGAVQAGSGIARSRARARVNWVSQGQRWGRCRVRRRAERVSRPAREKNRRRRVLVVAVCSPRPIRAVQRARLCAITCIASQAPLAAKRPDGR